MNVAMVDKGRQVTCLFILWMLLRLVNRGTWLAPSSHYATKVGKQRQVTCPFLPWMLLRFAGASNLQSPHLKYSYLFSKQLEFQLSDQWLELCNYSIFNYKSAFVTHIYEICSNPDIERFKDLSCTFLAQATVGNKLFLLGGWTEGIAKALIQQIISNRNATAQAQWKKEIILETLKAPKHENFLSRIFITWVGDLGTESIERFIEDQFFLRFHDLAPPPPLPPSSASKYSLFQCVAQWSYWSESWGGWGKSHIILYNWMRKSLVLYKSFNTLWGVEKFLYNLALILWAT